MAAFGWIVVGLNIGVVLGLWLGGMFSRTRRQHFHPVWCDGCPMYASVVRRARDTDPVGPSSPFRIVRGGNHGKGRKT